MLIKTISKSELQNFINNKDVKTNYYKTAAGIIEVLCVQDYIFKVIFVDKKNKNLEFSNLIEQDIKLLVVGTDFQIKVWQETINIISGSTKSYQEIAVALGNSKSYRAVARALSQNKIAYFIPCHRVIAKDGKLSGYRWGIDKKQALLTDERN